MQLSFGSFRLATNSLTGNWKPGGSIPQAPRHPALRLAAEGDSADRGAPGDRPRLRAVLRRLRRAR